MGGLPLGSVTLGMVATIAVTMLVTLAGRLWLTGRGSPPTDSLTLYQVAMLAGGPGRVSDTALSYLVWSGMLEVRDITDRLVRVVGINTVADLHPVELAVLGAVDPNGVRPEAAMGAGRMAARDHVEGLAGLAVGSREGRWLDGIALVGSGSVVGSGLWWLAAEDRTQIGFVPLMVLLAILYGIWWFASGRPRRTRAGDEVLEAMRRHYDEDLEIAAVGVTSLSLERAMHIIALYGRDALTGGLSGLRKVMTGNPSPVPVRSTLGT